MELQDEKINISSSRELIPINNGLTNFQSDFSIISENKQPFRAVIINQEHLDAGEDNTLEMKHASKGVFSGRIIQNSGKKDYWYIAVESDKPIEAALSLNTVQIDQASSDTSSSDEDADTIPKKKKKSKLWLIVLIIGIVLAVGYFLYKYIFAPKKETKPAIAPVPAPAPAHTIEPAPVSNEAKKPLKTTPPKEPTSPATDYDTASEGTVSPVKEEPKLNLDFSDLPPL